VWAVDVQRNRIRGDFLLLPQQALCLGDDLIPNWVGSVGAVEVERLAGLVRERRVLFGGRRVGTPTSLGVTRAAVLSPVKLKDKGTPRDEVSAAGQEVATNDVFEN
jgi:hypothetical protein